MSSKLNGVTSETISNILSACLPNWTTSPKKDSNIRIHCLRNPRSRDQFSNRTRAPRRYIAQEQPLWYGCHVVWNLQMAEMRKSYLLRWAEENLVSKCHCRN